MGETVTIVHVVKRTLLKTASQRSKSIHPSGLAHSVYFTDTVLNLKQSCTRSWYPRCSSLIPGRTRYDTELRPSFIHPRTCLMHRPSAHMINSSPLIAVSPHRTHTSPDRVFSAFSRTRLPHMVYPPITHGLPICPQWCAGEQLCLKLCPAWLRCVITSKCRRTCAEAWELGSLTHAHSPLQWERVHIGAQPAAFGA